MQDTMTNPGGLWLPLVTPFKDGEVDEPSLRRLVAHYAGEPVDGLILGATAGEGLALEEYEAERMAAVVAEALAAAGRKIPVYLGVGGSATAKVAAALARTRAWAVDGYLISGPNYVRPTQAGLVGHFTALAAATDRPVMIYNIPYRTGVNIGNAAMLALADLPNVVGVKDCGADAAQTSELLAAKPAGFSVLSGEDGLFHTALCQGAEGAIVVSGHVRPRAFAQVRALAAGDMAGALAAWRALAHIPRLLFAEPSPAPVKHWLWRAGLIDSPELRAPMTPVSVELAARIEAAITAG